jgi:hypothetical protein
MSVFQELNAEDNLKEIIKSAFASDLPISGSWGYTQALSTHILNSDTPYNQLEHMFASMRAYVEMNMTKEENDRYGNINVNETSREEHTLDQNTYHKIIYQITAMKESTYKTFIKEYKENYGKETFDLTLHFEKRKEATLQREVIHWFKIT